MGGCAVREKAMNRVFFWASGSGGLRIFTASDHFFDFRHKSGEFPCIKWNNFRSIWNIYTSIFIYIIYSFLMSKPLPDAIVHLLSIVTSKYHQEITQFPYIYINMGLLLNAGAPQAPKHPSICCRRMRSYRKSSTLSRAMALIGSTRVIAMAPVSWKVDGWGGWWSRGMVKGWFQWTPKDKESPYVNSCFGKTVKGGIVSINPTSRQGL